MHRIMEYASNATLESIGLTPALPERITGVVVGVLTGITENGEPTVDFPGSPAGLQRNARSTVALTADVVGREVALMFEGGDPHRPLVIGMIQHATPQSAPTFKNAAVVADGKRTVIKAEDEIELRCGQSSITLTKAGKVIIRGAYLLSRSSGVNRIKGGSVQIN
jgi:hypothetical protein